MNYFFLVVIFGTVCTGGVHAQCYNCTFSTMGELTMGSDGCADPFKPAGIQKIPCTGPCMKQYLDMESPVAGQSRISMTLRGCSPQNIPCVELDQMVVAGQTMSQNCCEGALCNSQGVSKISGFLAVFSLLGALLLLW